MKIKKGDTVLVITGKYKGTKTTVEKVNNTDSKVLLKDVNVFIKHLKKVEGEGGRVKITKPVDSSNVMLVCSKCDKPTRVGYRMEGNKKVRFCKKCQEII